jgi:hypothetical protein
VLILSIVPFVMNFAVASLVGLPIAFVLASIRVKTATSRTQGTKAYPLMSSFGIVSVILLAVSIAALIAIVPILVGAAIGSANRAGDGGAPTVVNSVILAGMVLAVLLFNLSLPRKL